LFAREPIPIGRKKQMQKIRPRETVAEKCGREYESWARFGDAGRFHTIYKRYLKYKPLNFLYDLKKVKPKIMILGAGKGDDLVLLSKELQQSKIYPEIDVFSLTKSLSREAKEVVNEDYSHDVSLESLGANPEIFSDLISKIKGKYDLVMASLSVGVHTDFPVHNCFYSAMMLAPNGEAYIQIRLYQLSMLREIYSSIYPKLVKVFPKLVDAYNKKYNTNLRFVLESLEKDSLSTALAGWVRIKRVN